ncbi:MAG: GNAT family N-acetyltransferase [Solirubrobacteraceae bacterium]
MSEAQLITDLADLRALAPEWDALAVAASNPAGTPAWVLSWLSHVAPADLQPRVVAVRDRGTLVGVAPFCVTRHRRGIVEYRLMGGDFGVCMEPLAIPGLEWDVAAAVARSLASCDPAPDVVALGPMSVASHWPAGLSSGWPGPMRALVRRYRLDGAPVIVLRELSFDAWFDSLSGKLRRSLRQGERLFEQAGGTTRWSTAETLRADAEAFARLHGQRWEGRRSRLADLGERLPDWFEELADELIGEERFRMCVLEVDGTPICVDFGIVAGAEFAAVNTGWDERYARLGPAKLAVTRMVASAFEQGCARLHLGLGNFATKLRLANGNDPVAWTIIMPPSPRLPYTYSRLLPVLVRRRMRDAAERALPPERFESARMLSQRLRVRR